MAAFLGVAVLMLLLALAFVVPALLRASRCGSGVSRCAANAAIHRAALDLLERESRSGLLDTAAYRSARDEIFRRVLAESAEDPPASAFAGPGAGAYAVALAVPLVAAVMYGLVGNPGALRADPGGLPDGVAGIEQHLRHAPRDGRAWVILARLQMDENRYEAAARSYGEALAVAPHIARDPGIWCELADALGMAQGGSLRGRPRELIEKALAMQADHPRALEMAGSAAYEAGDYHRTLAYWGALLAQLPVRSAEYGELALALERVRARFRPS